MPLHNLATFHGHRKWKKRMQDSICNKVKRESSSLEDKAGSRDFVILVLLELESDGFDADFNFDVSQDVIRHWQVVVSFLLFKLIYKYFWYSDLSLMIFRYLFGIDSMAHVEHSFVKGDSRDILKWSKTWFPTIVSTRHIFWARSPDYKVPR